MRYFYMVLTSAALSSAAFCVSSQVSHQTPTTDADALSVARTIGNTARAQKRFYPPQFDLSGLPAYRPEQRVFGSISQWGNNYLADSGLMAIWQSEFTKHHPDIRFDDHLYSSSVGFPGLVSGAADLAAMGRQALWDELKGFERAASADTELVEIIIATGSFDVRGWSYALGAFVHKDNPLRQLTLEQLDGILGAQRDGGWNGLTWDTSVARSAEHNIRTWGQLGLTGEWANQSITVYGYNMKYHFNDEIDKKVLKGSGKWNESMRAFSNMAGLKADGSLTPGGELIMQTLSQDRYGIAYTGIPFITAQTRALALSPTTGQPYVELTLDNVQNRSYPLLRDVYYYVRRERGKPLEPKLREFLRYILSRDGQQALQEDGKYLPLTAQMAREQLRKLD